MIILGLGGILADAACALLRDGELVAAIEEKKVERHRIPGGLPETSAAECLKLAGVSPAQVDCVALVRPISFGPASALHLELRAMFPNARLALVEHHMAHAASVYYVSKFESATVLTLDRGGDFRCGARWHAEGNEIRIDQEMYYPDSLGDLFGRVTELLGFEPRSEEHKVQWLSTEGDESLLPLFREILSANTTLVDRSYLDDDRAGAGGFGFKFYDRIGVEDGSEIPPSQRAAIARGVQAAVEEKVLQIAGEGENLCLAGGLFYNVLLVAAIEQSGRWKNVVVQPVAGNAGTSIGAVLYAWHSVYGQTKRATLGDLCLGPSATPDEVKEVLENCKLRFRYLMTTDELIGEAMRRIGGDQIVAWMQGRMEFGPRALGNRSILASPKNPYSTENLNNYIKRRESFRKFAASVPAEVAGEYFETTPNARYIATVSRVRPEHRKTFEPAVMGRDYVRVQVVERTDNPLYHRLLCAAGEASGLPVLYNTSFNLFGDPLVCRPRDAVRSFYSSGIDALFCGNFLVEK
jgi:carbamoyltransferase